MMIVILFSGCGPRYYLPADRDTPGKIVVSAYTQNSCMGELQEEADKRGVKVLLKNVEADLGWQIFLYPFYKGYRCTGEVIVRAR